MVWVGSWPARQPYPPPTTPVGTPRARTGGPAAAVAGADFGETVVTLGGHPSSSQDFKDLPITRVLHLVNQDGGQVYNGAGEMVTFLGGCLPSG